MAKNPKVKRKPAPRKKRESVRHVAPAAGMPTEQAEADRRLPGGIRFDAYVVEPWYRRAWAKVRRVFA